MACETSWCAERLVDSLAMIGSTITAVKKPKNRNGTNTSASIVHSISPGAFAPLAQRCADGAVWTQSSDGDQFAEFLHVEVAARNDGYDGPVAGLAGEGGGDR